MKNSLYCSNFDDDEGDDPMMGGSGGGGGDGYEGEQGPSSGYRANGRDGEGGTVLIVQFIDCLLLICAVVVVVLCFCYYYSKQ